MRDKEGNNRPQDSTAPVAQQTRKMSTAQSNEFYQRLVEAQKQTEEITNRKRAMLKELRDYEETKELQAVSRQSTSSDFMSAAPLAKEEVESLLRRFENDQLRRQEVLTRRQENSERTLELEVL